jgi:hypothetical protein
VTYVVPTFAVAHGPLAEHVESFGHPLSEVETAVRDEAVPAMSTTL